MAIYHQKNKNYQAAIKTHLKNKTIKVSILYNNEGPPQDFENLVKAMKPDQVKELKEALSQNSGAQITVGDLKKVLSDISDGEALQ